LSLSTNIMPIALVSLWRGTAWWGAQDRGPGRPLRRAIDPAVRPREPRPGQARTGVRSERHRGRHTHSSTTIGLTQCPRTAQSSAMWRALSEEDGRRTSTRITTSITGSRSTGTRTCIPSTRARLSAMAPPQGLAHMPVAAPLPAAPRRSTRPGSPRRPSPSPWTWLRPPRSRAPPRSAWTPPTPLRSAC
jgi:hypothetical protein